MDPEEELRLEEAPLLSEEQYHTESSGGGSSSWIWIILLLFMFLIIIGLIVWLVFAYRRNPKDPEINFVNPSIEVSSPTSVTGRWTTTDKSDVVTIYATQEPPRIKSDGTVSNQRFTKAVAGSGADSVILGNLITKAKYYITLIATNSDTVNYQSYTQVVYMQNLTPKAPPADPSPPVTNVFTIQDILQVGELEIVPSTSGGSVAAGNAVQLVQNVTDVNNTRWFVNSNNQIQSLNNDLCLYNNNGTLTAGTCSDLNTGTQLALSQWTYNPPSSQNEGYANRWCLTQSTGSTTTSSTPSCMILGTLNSNGKTAITVGTSVAANGFVNVCAGGTASCDSTI